MKPYLALIRNDIRLAFRQRIVIFFNYLMPFTFFFMFAQSSHAEQGGAILPGGHDGDRARHLGNGLLGAGMRAAQDRETNILRRYKVAPISPLPLLVASTVTGLVVYMPYVILMLRLAHRALRHGGADEYRSRADFVDAGRDRDPGDRPDRGFNRQFGTGKRHYRPDPLYDDAAS